ncbi:MAG: type II toxin-antitoxin system HigB family toxin [Gammaproteobacteria bacterium]
MWSSAIFRPSGAAKALRPPDHSTTRGETIAEKADWRSPQDVKQAHPKASILKGGRVVFNIKANDYRLAASVQYKGGALIIRSFGSHQQVQCRSISSQLFTRIAATVFQMKLLQLKG